MSLTFEAADEAWLKFLSRWAVALALVHLALPPSSWRPAMTQASTA